MSGEEPEVVWSMEKKYYVTCQLHSVHYSTSRGAALLKVKTDIGRRLKSRWIPCHTAKEYEQIEMDLEHSNYWRFS
jgi:hypothetical protein